MEKLKEVLKSVAVIGAAGKMGRGIALVILQQTVSQASFKNQLVLVDANENGLEDLKQFLRKHLLKLSGKNPGVTVETIETCLKEVVYSTDPLQAAKCRLVFEAIQEDLEVKAAVFRKIDAEAEIKPYYLSNTSSIPLSLIAERAGVEGRLIGFHFYNPPAIQKLIEIIIPKGCHKELIEISDQLIECFAKVKVISNDVPGFIGNGHFAREAAFALQKIRPLTVTCTFAEAVELLDFVTKNSLIRPMGIFQLMDYVGLEIVQKVGEVMRLYAPPSEELEMPYLQTLLERGVRGGQTAQGLQLNGFFSYHEGKQTGVYDLEKAEYVAIQPMESEIPTWKSLLINIDREKILKEYFESFWGIETEEGKLAQEFLTRSDQIIDKLVSDGVAASKEDVKNVLKLGFYHLY